MVLWAGPDWSQRSISEGPEQQQKRNKLILFPILKINRLGLFIHY